MTLSTGGANDMPANWGFPSPIYNHATAKYETHGFVWFGKAPASASDIAALKARFGKESQFDAASICGKKDKSWSYFNRIHSRKYPYKQTIMLGVASLFRRRR